MKAKILRCLLLLISIGHIIAIVILALVFAYGFAWDGLILDILDLGITCIISFALWYIFKRMDEQSGE